MDLSWLNPTVALGGLIAAVVPLLVLYIIYTLDLYQSGAFPLILLSFAWGAVTFPIAAAINTWFIYNETTFVWVTEDNFARFVSPPVEELLKPLILLAFILIQRHVIRSSLFTYFVDGAIYGFAVGIGFAVIENFSYISFNPEAALGIAIGRVISTNLIHAAASGMFGIAMGLATYKRFSGGLVLYASFLLVALAIHMGFNNLVVLLGDNPLIVVFAAVAGAIAIGLIVYAIRRGLRDEKDWIDEKIEEARVSSSEAELVRQLDSLDELLAPIGEIFPDKIAAIKDYLRTKATLTGIKRKTIDLLPDEQMKQAAREQVAQLEKEMNAARVAIGYGAMIYVRGIFPDDDSLLWDMAASRIEAAAAARPAMGGVDAFGALAGRIAEGQSASSADGQNQD